MSLDTSLISQLEEKVSETLIAYQKLNEENDKLKQRVEKLGFDLKKANTRAEELEDINQQMKVVNAMLGSSEHRRLMKMKLNKLVREVDACIADVKKQSI